MLCPYCQHEISTGASQCPHCKGSLQHGAPGFNPGPPDVTQGAGQPPINYRPPSPPYGQAPQSGPTPYASAYGQPPSPNAPHPYAQPYPQPTSFENDPAMRMLLPVGQSGWAIAAGYLGLFSLLCIPGPLALITGVMAIADIRKHPQKGGMGRAIVGIVLGALGTVGLILGLIAAASQ